jgi:hypothetical protein
LYVPPKSNIIFPIHAACPTHLTLIHLEKCIRDPTAGLVQDIAISWLAKLLLGSQRGLLFSGIN